MTFHADPVPAVQRQSVVCNGRTQDYRWVQAVKKPLHYKCMLQLKGGKDRLASKQAAWQCTHQVLA